MRGYVAIADNGRVALDVTQPVALPIAWPGFAPAPVPNFNDSLIAKKTAIRALRGARLRQCHYPAITGSMRRLLPLLACLMLVLTAWVGVAHAAEVGGCIETSQYQAGSHVDDDGKLITADADKGYPHHHGSCHAHHMSAPDANSLAGRAGPTCSTLATTADATLVGRDADTALRPPQA